MGAGESGAHPEPEDEMTKREWELLVEIKVLKRLLRLFSGQMRRDAKRFLRIRKVLDSRFGTGEVV